MTAQTAQILDGKKISMQLQAELKLHIAQSIQKGLAPPGLAVILVGSDPASQIYVHHKHQACIQVGIKSEVIQLDKNVTEVYLLTLIKTLNHRVDIHGILVQLPLPPHIQTHKILDAVSPSKDVDGFHPLNLGYLAQQRPLLRPCTPAGIMNLLAAYDLTVKGANATVVGVSNIVGRPMLLELLQANATVTACHLYTKNLQAHIQNADILIVAIGNPNFIPGHFIKSGAIVVDVGMNRSKTGQIVGDVNFEEACQRAAWITPVPGGVGPMTVTTLLQNTILAAWGVNSETFVPI